MNPHLHKIASIMKEMQISADALHHRLALLSFDEPDRRIIAQLSDWFALEQQSIVDEISAEFSEANLTSFGVFAGFDMSRLFDLISGYISDMLSGCFDEAYAQKRVELGVIHHELRITPERFTGIVAQCEEKLLRAYCRNNPDLETCLATAAAVHKIVLFDMTLVLESYAHTEHQSIEQMATRDPLTGLGNHHRITTILSQLLETCDADHPIALFFIGLSRFKAVNETLGHQIGDRVLQEIAGRLSDVFQKTDYLARLGGDIFVVVSPDTAEADIQALCEKILTALNRSFRLDEFSVDITVALGATVTDDGDSSPANLLSRAEMALRHAKLRNLSFALFANEMKKYSITQLAIIADLRRAIEQDELLLFYQPKVRLSDLKVVGAEALIRWLHPMRGLIPPGQFIPAAEESVLVHPLTDWVLDTAFSQVAAWWQAGLQWVISINLSAANLQNQELPGHLAELLSHHRVEPEMVMLEITESALMSDPTRALETVRRIKELGLRFSIDDFGTGYSSLSYLKDLPVDEVKVDQTFVFSMHTNQKDARIVRATVNLGHALDLSVTAEGVEDEATLDDLRSIGCDSAQGYFIAKPMPSDELVKWHQREWPH